MKNQYDRIGIVYIFIIIYIFGSWVYNGKKFLSCDFESNYKCEIVHGAGVFIPPASLITVFFETDN